jgi:hypothetical protein
MATNKIENYPKAGLGLLLIEESCLLFAPFDEVIWCNLIISF